MELEASDLRFGSYVKSGSNIFQITEIKKDRVTGIHKDCIFGRLYQHLEPIPLTEQWLIDFGFIKNDDCGGNGYQLGNMIVFKVHEPSNPDYWFYEIEYHYRDFNSRTAIIDKYDYVHQLQSLYFALIEKELTK